MITIHRDAEHIIERIDIRADRVRVVELQAQGIIEVMDQGSAEILEDGPEFKKLLIEGKKLKGTWAVKKRKGSALWSMNRNEGPGSIAKRSRSAAWLDDDG